MSLQINSFFSVRVAFADLVDSYHNSDCCICPEGSVIAGGHTSADNRCADVCVSIKKK
jgi:hypothetical protein